VLELRWVFRGFSHHKLPTFRFLSYPLPPFSPSLPRTPSLSLFLLSGTILRHLSHLPTGSHACLTLLHFLALRHTFHSVASLLESLLSLLPSDVSPTSDTLPDEKKPDQTVAKSKRLASRFYQMKTGHCLTGQYLAWTTRRPGTTCWWCQYKIQTREHLFKNCPQWKSQQKTLWATVLETTRKLPGPTRSRDRTSIAELLADQRCSQVVLTFLATTDVRPTGGRRG